MTSQAFSRTQNAKSSEKQSTKTKKSWLSNLPGFAGLLGRELMPNFRVGTELSDRAKFWGRVGGIFHTDEMPNYGITAEEVEALRKAVDAAEE